MLEYNKRELVEKALEARKFSYSPYSNFRVGAALLAEDGQIIKGCNIENAAFSPTNCAERTAVFKAVSEGITEFKAIAIVGGPGDEEPSEIAAPCGVCRQVLREFCDPEKFIVLLGKGDKTWKEYTLEELLPLGFAGKNL
ncbi:cytidine deaminase [Anaerosacchariphilus polymeriproducens]|uniref:Cytidine deaminase n=1 Tax=Anaerosacchariphilus polymeriproducens TaxID=1812858 RepID=A0A371AW05_9FIRM|nr:cytidine deaminase [Anaerosacchariphilus polymeriproducens]RDU23722.1 cytidine deaminase [Anaerosacchariphilus polymeriproducens]